MDRVRTNTLRYITLFANAIDQHMPTPSINFKEDQLTTFEILMQQRKFNFDQSIKNAQMAGLGAPNDAKLMLPPELER